MRDTPSAITSNIISQINNYVRIVPYVVKPGLLRPISGELLGQVALNPPMANSTTLKSMESL